MRVPLKLSKQFIFFLVFFMVGSVLIIASLPIDLRYRGLLWTMTVFYSAYLYWQSRQWTEPDDLTQLSGDSLITTWVCVFRFKNKEKTSVIFRDAMEKERFRQLLAVVSLQKIL